MSATPSRDDEIANLREEVKSLRVALGIARSEKHSALARLREVAAIAAQFHQELEAPKVGGNL